MPITAPVTSAVSTAQVVATAQVFDYLLSDASKAIANARVTVSLDYAQATTISPLVQLGPVSVITTTDGNGYWSVNLIPTDNISPANNVYTVETPFRTYQITVPSGGPWQSTAVGIIVNTPVALVPAVTGLTGPLTISSGGLTVSAGGASIAGGLTLTSGVFSIPAGGFSMLGPLTLTAAHSQIIPGATDFSVRDTGNGNDNLLVSNAGLVTARAGLVATAGGLTVSAGGAAITGNSVVTGTLTATAGLTVSAGGIAVTGTSTVTGTLGVTGLLTAQAAATVSAGDLTVSAGRLVMSAATSKLVPGATALQLRNHADGATNLLLPDNGQAVLRNGLALLGGAVDVGAGTLGYAQVTANQAGWTTVVDITGLTVTVTVGTGRRVRITVFIEGVQSTTVTDTVIVTIVEGVATLAAYNVVANNQGINCQAVIQPSAAAHTYKAQIQRVGAGTGTLSASATTPAFILCEDIGS